MKLKLKVETEVDVRILSVSAGVRYWEDSTVNGIEDTNGSRIPFRDGDYWCPQIDIDSGNIINWPQGLTANIHYKVCDDGVYVFKDEAGNVLLTKEGYVPSIMCPKEDGYGDYIIMDIDENGVIADWEFDIEDFEGEED